MNGRSGRGPSHMSQSRPGGGSESGSLPIPSGAMLLVKAARATVTLPIAPDCTISASFAYMADDRRWVPTWTTRLYRRAASTMRRPSRIVMRQRLLAIDVLCGRTAQGKGTPIVRGQALIVDRDG